MKNRDYSLYNVSKLRTLKELINSIADRYNNNTAFCYTKKNTTINISYKQFKADVDALGTVLHSMELRSQKIAVIGENSYEWIITYFAAINGGSVIVPIDKELPENEIENLLSDCGASVLVYSDDYSDIAPKVAPDIRCINMKSELPSLLVKGAELISEGNRDFIDAAIDENALAAIIYTSGTTGFAKGVMLSHKNLATDVVASWENVWIESTSMLVLPLHHTFAMTTSVLCMLHMGRTIIINSSLKRLLSDMSTFQPQNMFVVPLFVENFYKRIWDTARQSGKDKLLKVLVEVSNCLLKVGIDIRRMLFKSILSTFGGKLDLLVCGGAPLDAKYVKGLRNFGINVLNGYGITECSPVVAVNRNNHYRDGSVGSVLSACEVKIMEPDENGCGEICVKGDIVMLGYYNNDSATQAVYDGEWFKTGDIGYLDEDGFLFITGRIKNMVVMGNGKNVYPEEIESALLNLPYIKEVIVRGEYSEKRGDVILVAEIYPDYEVLMSPGVENNEEYFNRTIAEFNKTIPSYKHIQRVILRETEFVKTTTKKIKRNMGGHE